MIHYKLINTSGIRSLPAGDAAVRGMVGASLDDVKASGLEPYSIAVFNDTDKTMIASVVRTTLVDKDGNTRVSETIFLNLRLRPNGGVIPNGNEVAARSSRIVSPLKSFADTDQRPSRGALNAGTASTSIGSGGRSLDSKMQELATQQDAVISLDLVIYEDGRVMGPDEGGLTHNIRAQLQVERDLAFAVQQALSATNDMSVIQEFLTRTAEINVRPRLLGDGAADHWLDFFTVQASNYYLYRARSGKDDLVATINEVLGRPVLTLAQ